MNPVELPRISELITSIVKKLKLDLRGLTVLTEVGSGYFSVTPAIALAAGAKKVYAWTKDSHYGTGSNNIAQCVQVVKTLALDAEAITFANGRRPAGHVHEADIITNLGFVRPLDRSLLESARNGIAVPLMCEAWELRQEDLDLETIREKQILLAGTWENEPSLRIFDACGILAAKLILEAQIEIYQSRILIYSPDHFGEVILKALENMQPESVTLVKSYDQFNNHERGNIDCIFICDYTSEDLLVGEGGRLSVLPGTQVVHLSGKIDSIWASNKKIPLYPEFDGKSRRMTRTLAYLGPKFIIDLHAAGLKVGEYLCKGLSQNKLVQLI